MSLRLSHTTWDALDPHAIAEFWRALLGWEVDEPHLYRPGSDECSLVGPDGQVVLFFRVPDAKRVKNRAHMDL
ncbi:VOC family protein, partial [Pantoea sp. SIMBA_133]